MRSHRATTCSITSSAQASTGAGARSAIASLRAHRPRNAGRRLHGHGRRRARSPSRRTRRLTVRLREFSASTLLARCSRSDCGRFATREKRSVSRSFAATRCESRSATAVADAATVAFGIRNVQQPDVAVRELARVLRPGGRLAILEFSVPRIPGLARALSLVFQHACCRSSAGRSRVTSGAYSYLPASVGTFPPPAEFVTLLRHAGFTEVRAVPLTFGIVYLYTAVKINRHNRVAVRHARPWVTCLKPPPHVIICTLGY